MHTDVAKTVAISLSLSWLLRIERRNCGCVFLSQDLNLRSFPRSDVILAGLRWYLRLKVFLAERVERWS